METRGRKSAAELAVVPFKRPEIRPDPPKELTAEQAEVWRETVASEAASFFGTAALRSLLGEYCRHTVTARMLGQQIDLFDPAWLNEVEGGMARLDALTRMRDRETKAAADKATKLRLTNQSRYTPQAAATASGRAGAAKKPWET